MLINATAQNSKDEFVTGVSLLSFAFGLIYVVSLLVCNQCIALKQPDENLESLLKVSSNWIYTNRLILKQAETMLNDDLMKYLISTEGLADLTQRPNTKGRQIRKAKLERKKLG